MEIESEISKELKLTIVVKDPKEDKVNELKTKIARGDYKVDSNKIVEGIIKKIFGSSSEKN